MLIGRKEIGADFTLQLRYICTHCQECVFDSRLGWMLDASTLVYCFFFLFLGLKCTNTYKKHHHHHHQQQQELPHIRATVFCVCACDFRLFVIYCLHRFRRADLQYDLLVWKYTEFWRGDTRQYTIIFRFLCFCIFFLTVNIINLTQKYGDSNKYFKL